jgi:hypothetical protein
VTKIQTSARAKKKYNVNEDYLMQLDCLGAPNRSQARRSSGLIIRDRVAALLFPESRTNRPTAKCDVAIVADRTAQHMLEDAVFPKLVKPS